MYSPPRPGNPDSWGGGGAHWSALKIATLCVCWGKEGERVGKHAVGRGVHTPFDVMNVSSGGGPPSVDGDGGRDSREAKGGNGGRQTTDKPWGISLRKGGEGKRQSSWPLPCSAAVEPPLPRVCGGGLGAALWWGGMGVRGKETQAAGGLSGMKVGGSRRSGVWTKERTGVCVWAGWGG